MTRTIADSAERDWKERRARERGRAWLYGLHDAMTWAGMTSGLASEQVDIPPDTIRQYRRVDASAPLVDAEMLAEILDVSLGSLMTLETPQREEKPRLSIYDLFYIGMPPIEELTKP